jgi:putative transposase
VKKRFTEEQIIGFLREAERGVAAKDLCRRHGFSEASYYLWRGKFGGMDVSDAKLLKAFESENARLKKPLAESMLENEVTVRRYERSGSRTGSAGPCAVDAKPGIVGAARAAGDAHERELSALPAGLRARIVALA